jgi:hypothetical protein
VAVAAATMMLAVSLTPASALTLSAPSLAPTVATSHIEKVWWCRWNCGPGWGWRGGRWGYWGPAAVVAGVAAGAVVGAAIAAPPPYYGPAYYPAPAYGGPCWRRVIGPYGGVSWQRVC